MAVTALLITAFVLLAVGVPVGIALGGGILATVLGFHTTNLSFLAQQMYSGFDSLTLIAIPAFMLCGGFMNVGGLSKRLVDFCRCLVGDQVGGLGTVAIIACLFFGAISGSGPATVVAIGGIMIPHMVHANYNKAYATALAACAGGLGIIIPPSIPLVVYGCQTNTSIGDLFIAGIGPGIVVALCLIVANVFVSRKNGLRGGHKVSMKELLKNLWDAKWSLLMPVIILGGIYGGIFTPTEAAVVANVYAVIVGRFIYKELTFKAIWDEICNNSSLYGATMLTFAPAAALGSVFAMLQVPTALTNLLMSISTNKYVILLVVNVFLLFIGMIVDSIPTIIIFGPMLLAALKNFGVDPVHFGLILILNVAIGFVTPPVAGNLNVASGMTRVPIWEIAKKELPFLVAMYVALIIVTFVPQISIGLLGR